MNNGQVMDGRPVQVKHPLASLMDAWTQVIRKNLRAKGSQFQVAADECKRFLAGGTKVNDWMWGAAGAGKGGYVTDANDIDLSPPLYQFTTNKPAELLQLFAPTLYNRNPIRTCTPRKYDPIPPAIYGAMNPQLLITATTDVPPPPMPPPNVPLDPMQQQQLAMQQQQVAQAQQRQQQAAQALEQMVTQERQADEIQQVMDMTRAQLMEEVLNYTPRVLDLKGNSRLVIDEALLKGAGCWWVEMFAPEETNVRFIGSFYDTFDNCLLDADVEKLDDCKWIARRCIHPQWEVEDEYGLARGALDVAAKPDGTNTTGQAPNNPSDMRTDAERAKRGITNDLIVYWKIYSKMGMGGRMASIPSDLKNLFDGWGNYCLIVLCEGVPYPLNLPSEKFAEADTLAASGIGPEVQAAVQAKLQEMQQAVSWPIPFHYDGRGWPMTILAFHPQNNYVYPYSHVAVGLGELKWINWCMSFLAGKVKSSCTTIVAVAKGLPEEEKKKVIQGADQRVVEIDLTSSKDGRIGDVVQYLQQPPFHADIYNVLARVEQQFDDRVGLSELLRGRSGEATPRSATDVSVRQQNSSIRLDDMANSVQEAMTEIANKEAFAWKFLGEQADVLPILGAARTRLWGELIMKASIEEIIWKLDFRIESGSMAKPNNEAKLQQLTQLGAQLIPVLQKFVEGGQVGPWNAYMEDLAKAMGVDPTRYLIPPPPPPQPAPPPGQPGQPAGQQPQQPGEQQPPNSGSLEQNPQRQHGAEPSDIRHAA